MTSSPLTDQSSRVDTVDALRLLMADLQSLADRLQLKENSRSLQQSLKATQERVSGPRAAVMLLSEEAEPKRRFLERLLGPGLSLVPETSDGVTRLEYGAEAEGVVVMPQGLTAVLPLEQMKSFLGRSSKEMPRQAERTIRLPNAALARGLMVIDTPPVEAGEPEPTLLHAAAGADAWVLVLGPEGSLHAGTQALLRRLPQRAERLEVVVESAEALSGEQRAVTRVNLEKLLRDSCGVAEPRVQFISASATDIDGSGFWQGRSATFPSLLMLRGRERWLESTRALVGDALADVASEIEFELKGSSLGLRQARLRLGLKDLEGLRARFVALGELEGDRAKATKPSLVPAFVGEPAAAAQPGDAPAAAGDMPQDAAQVGDHADAAVSGIPPAPMGEPTFVRFQAQDAASPAMRAGVLARLLQLVKAGKRATSDTERTALPWRVAGAGLVAVFVCLIGWALWPRIHPSRQAAAQWDYQPPAQTTGEAAAPSPAPGASGASGPANPGANPGADPGASSDVTLGNASRAEAAPDSAQTEIVGGQPSAATAGLRPSSGTLLPRAVLHRPAQASVNPQRAPRKRHHSFLGLGRVWHWIRHPAGGSTENER